MKFNRLASAALVAYSLVATSAFADAITLNPSAPNGALGALSADGHFKTDKATTNFASVMTINVLPVVGNSGSVVETGFFLVESFGIVSGLGTSSGVVDNYNIYALFTITGTGTWTSTTDFEASPGGLALNATFYGSPGGGSVNPFTPTEGTFGITPNSDIILGTANLQLADDATAKLRANNRASTSFQALLNFVPAVGTTGLGGFWEAPTPFNVTFGAAATGNALNGNNGTSYTVDPVAGKTVITTNVTDSFKGSGAGSINFSVNRVPEPGSLVLIGLAMAALGLSRRFIRP